MEQLEERRVAGDGLPGCGRDLPLLFYENMAAYGEAALLPVLEGMGWHPLRERLNSRCPNLRSERQMAKTVSRNWIDIAVRDLSFPK